MRSRDSFGLGICRKRGETYEILLCQRRVSYEFLEFLRGRFLNDDYEKINKLYIGMTKKEKELLMSNNFNNMISHAGVKENINSRKRINNAIEYIRKGTNNNQQYKDLIWDLPKGKQEKFEKDLDTAVRETQEELSISPNQYKVLFDISPIRASYIDYEVTYNFTFYVAEYTSMTDEWQVDNLEIHMAKWHSFDDLQVINSPLVGTMNDILAKFRDYKCSNLNNFIRI